MKIISIISFVLAFTLASTTFAHPPRIKPVYEGLTRGYFSLVKDGVKYKQGVLGFNLTEVVADNPAAVEYAKVYESNDRTSRMFALTSFLTAGATGVYALSAAIFFSDKSINRNSMWWVSGLLTGALVTGLSAAYFHGVAANAFFDSINTYNEGDVEAPKKSSLDKNSMSFSLAPIANGGTASLQLRF